MKHYCLNPCFNGRCTRTDKPLMCGYMHIVLILVLMEDALVQLQKEWQLISRQEVLILVLMEDALVLGLLNFLAQIEGQS